MKTNQELEKLLYLAVRETVRLSRLNAELVTAIKSLTHESNTNCGCTSMLIFLFVLTVYALTKLFQ